MSVVHKGAIVVRSVDSGYHGGMEPDRTRGLVVEMSPCLTEAKVKAEMEYAWHNVDCLDVCVAAAPSQPAALPVTEHVVSVGGKFIVSPVSQTDRWREIAADKLRIMELDLEMQQEMLYAEQSAIQQVRLKIENGSLFDV
jgi:hypothetical protein